MLIEYHKVNIEVAGRTLLSDVNFTVDEGEFVYLIGQVGSGKSSFLRTLYGELSLAGEGWAKVLGHDLFKLRRKHHPVLRRRLGIVFQDFQLLSDRTVADNIDFVLRSTGWRKKELRQQRLEEVLEEVGLIHKADSYPHELSGGEQQRISLARALVNQPEIILADEPTGNLDRKNSAKIMDLLKRISERGTAVVMITHNLDILNQYPGIVYRCEDGRMEEVTAEYNKPIDMAEDTVSLSSEEKPVTVRFDLDTQE